MNINTVMLIIIMNCVELFYTGDKGNTKYKQLSPVTLEMLIKLMASIFLSCMCLIEHIMAYIKHR